MIYEFIESPGWKHYAKWTLGWIYRSPYKYNIYRGHWSKALMTHIECKIVVHSDSSDTVTLHVNYFSEIMTVLVW